MRDLIIVNLGAIICILASALYIVIKNNDKEK
jgi:hypothetical protein